MTCGGIIRPHSSTSVSHRAHAAAGAGQVVPEHRREHRRGSRIDSAVTMMLLVRLTQNRRSGRVSTAAMLSSVGGIGSDAGLAAMIRRRA